MSKDSPKMPVMLLLVLGVLIIGIILSSKVDQSTDRGVFKRVQNKHEAEKNLYEVTP